MATAANPALSAASPDDAGSTSLTELLAMARRRRRVLWLSFGLLLLAAVLVALLVPPVYRSTATILIKEQEIPPELVRSTITTYADERIQVIRQQVMTRATLLGLVERYDLYASVRKRETNEEILERMRGDIRLQPISAEVTDRRTGAPARSTIAFTLSYDSQFAENAQKIASELTTLFLNENLKNRQQKAAETTTFLQAELSRVSDHISELEQELADFRRRNQGRTPELGLSNLSASDRAETELQRVDREIGFVRDRRRTLEAQLVETPARPPPSAAGASIDPDDRLQLLRLQMTSLRAAYSDDHPDVRRVQRELKLLQDRVAPEASAAERERSLAQVTRQIAQLRQRYSADHPDVQRLQRIADALAVAMRMAAGDKAAASSQVENPLYLALKSQIELTGSQLALLAAERSDLQGKLALFSARVAQAPEIEREYLQRVRDLDSSRLRFRELREKGLQAQVAEQLELSRKAERFTIIEPPIFPEKPYRPNRPLILLLGALLALGGSAAAVALAESLDQSVRGAPDVLRVMQVPVLAVLPPLAEPASAQRRRRFGWLLGLVAVVALAVGVVLFDLFVMPLDVAWYALLRRIW